MFLKWDTKERKAGPDGQTKIGRAVFGRVFWTFGGHHRKMESREITLEEAFEKYQEGMALLKSCNEKIDRVEKKMLVLGENGETDEI